MTSRHLVAILEVFCFLRNNGCKRLIVGFKRDSMVCVGLYANKSMNMSGIALNVGVETCSVPLRSV